MDRRNFLHKSSLALAGGLLLGPAALEAFERLTWRRKYWSGAFFLPPAPYAQLVGMDGRPINEPWAVARVTTHVEEDGWVRAHSAEFGRSPLGYNVKYVLSR